METNFKLVMLTIGVIVFQLWLGTGIAFAIGFTGAELIISFLKGPSK